MNEKIAKYARQQGFCCMWAFLEAKRAKLTSQIMRDMQGVCTVRALQQQRAAHRAKETQCKNLPECLKKRIRDGYTIP